LRSALPKVNQGYILALAVRPAPAQLDNRQRRFGLRLLGRPQGDQAREVLGAASSGLGKRLEKALGYTGRVEATVLVETPEALAAATVVEGQEATQKEAERPRQGLTLFTDGSKRESGASGYAVVWRRGEQ